MSEHFDLCRGTRTQNLYPVNCKHVPYNSAAYRTGAHTSDPFQKPAASELGPIPPNALSTSVTLPSGACHKQVFDGGCSGRKAYPTVSVTWTNLPILHMSPALDPRRVWEAVGAWFKTEVKKM